MSLVSLPQSGNQLWGIPKAAGSNRCVPVRRFTLLNLRADSKFVLITGGLGANLQAPNFTIIAQSPTIVNQNLNEPTQVQFLSLFLPITANYTVLS